MSKQPANLLPHVAFGILFALSAGPQYGYRLMRQIADDSVHKVQIGPGALYGTLKLLRDDNLIEELPFEDERERRRYYRLTRKGWNTLTADLAYYRNVARLAKTRNVLE